MNRSRFRQALAFQEVRLLEQSSEFLVTGSAPTVGPCVRVSVVVPAKEELLLGGCSRPPAAQPCPPRLCFEQPPIRCPDAQSADRRMPAELCGAAKDLLDSWNPEPLGIDRSFGARLVPIAGGKPTSRATLTSLGDEMNVGLGVPCALPFLQVDLQPVPSTSSSSRGCTCLGKFTTVNTYVTVRICPILPRGSDVP